MESDTECYISKIPNEIFGFILRFNTCREIMQFGSTCKRFYAMVNNNQILWRLKCKTVIPSNMIDIVQQNNSGDWLDEIILYYELRKQIFTNISSPYTQNKSGCFHAHANIRLRHGQLTDDDATEILLPALSHQYTLYYALYFLQSIVKGTADNLQFSDTEVILAKICQTHLIHCYLAVKWVVDGHFTPTRETNPEKVIMFFLQWVDTENIYLEEHTDAAIQQLVDKVKAKVYKKLESKDVANCNIQEILSKGYLKERNILDFVSVVMYNELNMQVTADASAELFNIPNVIMTKEGNVMVIAAIYQAVARHCGVKCELITFPNHLFLEWYDTESPMKQTYTIDISNGDIKPKRRCPFSQSTQNSDYLKNRADQIIFHLHASYEVSVVNNPHLPRDSYENNASLLLGYLSTGDENASGKYTRFLPYLTDESLQSTYENPLNLRCMHDGYLKIMRTLLTFVINMSAIVY